MKNVFKLAFEHRGTQKALPILLKTALIDLN